MILHIKNMVCNRCIMVVEQELKKLGFYPEQVTLGEVTLKETDLTKDQQEKIDRALEAVGFERIDDRKARLIESIKNKIIERVHHVESIDRKFNWSDILADELHHDYNSLSNLFSSL